MQGRLLATCTPSQLQHAFEKASKTHCPIPTSHKLILEGLENARLQAVGRTKSYCRTLMSLSEQMPDVTNRSAGSWWLFLRKCRPQ